MEFMLKNQPAEVFSESVRERDIEIKFASRLFRYLEELKVPDIHRMVNSGEFNRVFPALGDESSPVAPSRFEDLKPFDYQDWAKRNLP